MAPMYKIKRNDRATPCFYLPYSRSILAKTKNKALLSTKFGAMSTTFGKRIRECREAKKWSQAALAREMSVHHSLIGKYERDEVKPSIDIGQRLATVLGTTVGYLLGEPTDGDVLQYPAMPRLSLRHIRRFRRSTLWRCRWPPCAQPPPSLSDTAYTPHI